MTHAGLIGTAPSKELLDMWNTREKTLVDAGENATTLCGCLHTRPLACLPQAKGACLGKVGKGAEWDKIAGEAARTVPGRENGGNCDIKNLSRGCKVYFCLSCPSLLPFLSFFLPFSLSLSLSLFLCLFVCLSVAVSLLHCVYTYTNMHAYTDTRTHTQVYFPVFVEGANLSMGDMHFSQVPDSL